MTELEHAPDEQMKLYYDYGLHKYKKNPLRLIVISIRKWID